MVMSRSLAAPVIAVMLMLLGSSTPIVAQAHRLNEVDAAPPHAFDCAISQYVDLRRRLEPTLPALRVSGAEELTLAVDALTDAIRTARAGAQAGDIFSAGVAAFFRLRIEQALAASGSTVSDLLAQRDDEPTAGGGPVIVNGRFPRGLDSTMSLILLRALPPLPQELQYRVVDRDLVLIDIDTDLVVDILPDALPSLPGATYGGQSGH